MNILFISSKKGWGGVVTLMYRCALGLERRGHRVWILSHPDSLFTRSDPPGVTIIPRKLGMDFNPLMIGYLVAFIRRNGIDAILTNIKKEVVTGGIAARLCGIPNVRRIGSPDDLNDKVRWYQQRLVDHSVLPSEMTLKQAMGKVDWLDPDTFTTVHTGKNPADFTVEELSEQRGRWGLSGSDLIIGCTAQLAAVKGLDGLIRVFAGAVAEHPECALVLTGEGPERESLETLRTELGISGRVVFPGFSRAPMLASAAYDIAVLNSHSEGFPNTLVEYFAAGKAVVCTNVGGIPEIVEDGKNGLMIDPGDDRALTEKIMLLIEQPELRRRLGKSALDTLKAGFTEEGMIEAYERVFERAVAGKGR
ncbi:glycosyltransferase family 4 protein [Candidatus Eisenbacteria bacterium]|uniref:Glycosyltransferase family 4 protein n=1 Tax=Eiseniibacteriota bacterium TaxID=2212470 RepID=A0ABV6YNR7_UNCEI